MADFTMVASKDKSQNEHQKAETLVRLQQETKRLFEAAWIANPIGDVTYTMTISADDNKDTYVEQAAGAVADGAAWLKEKTVGKADPKTEVKIAKAKK